MTKRSRTAVTAMAAALLSAVATIAVPAVANAANPGQFTADGVKIRTGPSTGNTAIGSGYRGQPITAYCVVSGVAPGPGFNNVWVKITSHAINKTGYAHPGGPDQTWFTGTAGLKYC